MGRRSMSSWRGSWTWRPSASGSRRRSAKWTRASRSSGRSWRNRNSSSVRPRVPLGLWPLFSLTTAVAAAEALRRSTGLEARLKWPNDVLARGRKLGGILLESRSGAHAPALVIGVGLNLAQREFSLELAGLATSVALETGSAPARDAVLAALLEEFDAWRARLESEGGEPVRVR